jgi:hypothetical protein
MKNNPVQNIVRDVVTSYVTTSQVLLVGSILAIGSICSTPAHAATFNYSGNTTGAPTFDRGGGSNSVFPYDVFSFNVDVGGSYSFNSNTSFPYDNYGFLYQNSFNPTTPFNTNYITSNDDSSNIVGNYGGYGFSTSLNAGTNYFLVSTSFSPGVSGSFTTTIDGPGNVSASTSVPEPFTIIGTLVGGTAAIRMRKKLKSVNKG